MKNRLFLDSTFVDESDDICDNVFGTGNELYTYMRGRGVRETAPRHTRETLGLGVLFSGRLAREFRNSEFYRRLGSSLYGEISHIENSSKRPVNF